MDLPAVKMSGINTGPPIFIVGAPCSGQNALRAGLALAPGVMSAGATDFGEVAGIEPDPASPGGDSASAADLSEERIEKAREWISTRISEAAAKLGTTPLVPLRALGGIPRDSLRISMLDAIYPESRFIYVNRDPAEALARMAAIWKAGTVVTHPGLPGWQGPAWSSIHGSHPRCVTTSCAS